MNTKLAAVMLLSGVLSAACSRLHGEGSTVGAAGGTVTLDGVTVAVPAGALKNDTTISVSVATDASAPSGVMPVSAFYTVTPEGQQFGASVLVTLPVNLDQIPDGGMAQSVIVFAAPAGTSNYVPLISQLVDATHMQAQTTHFSTFVAASADCHFNGCPQPTSPNERGCIMHWGCGGDGWCAPACLGDCGHACDPTCASPSCKGCCDSKGRCQPGTSAGACGSAAASCTACSPGQCAGGACTIDHTCNAPATPCGAQCCTSAQYCVNNQLCMTKCSGPMDCSVGQMCDVASGRCI